MLLLMVRVLFRCMVLFIFIFLYRVMLFCISCLLVLVSWLMVVLCLRWKVVVFVF